MNGGRMWETIGAFTSKRAGAIVIATILLTIALVIPIFLMAPEKRAEGNPGGEVFDLTERIEDRMPAADLYTSFIVEARDGDVLGQKELLELYENEEKLRNSELGQKYLVNRYDVEKGTYSMGIFTIADAVNELLSENFERNLSSANDEMVKMAIHFVLNSEEGKAFRDTFSVKAEVEKRIVMKGTPFEQEIDYWTSPALVINTLSDNRLVEDEYSGTLEGDNSDAIVKEHFNRELQSHLRGDEDSYRLWGIAIDQNLEAEEEGMMSFPLIFAAVVLILIIITIVFRSAKVLGLTVIGIVMMLIWMKGLSNLVGLNSSLTIDMLVPISILVLGVDYTIHALHRYEEERGKGPKPRKALALSVAGVGGALMLAMITTVVAFGSNVISDIEEIVGFGVAASLAIIAAFWIMGFFLPSSKMLLDSWRENRRKKKGIDVEKERPKEKGSRLLGSIVLSIARARFVLVPLVVLISIGAGAMALQLEAKLDVKEYYDPSSDIVVSLDKLDEHMGDTGGEPVIFYIEGDLTDPEALYDLKELEENLSNDKNVARDPDTGKVRIYADIFMALNRTMTTNYTRSEVENSTGVKLTDDKVKGIPDTPEQLEALYGYMLANGLPLDENGTKMYDRAQIGEVLWKDEKEQNLYATIVMTGIPNTRELATIQEAEEEFREDLKALDSESIAYKGLTGSGFERDRTLTAVTDTLNSSIILAVILCFIVLVVLLRSFKYAFVTVIPEVLVAAWLYAFMFIAGFHLNAVTATIAAISIGVGIDYSVHVTARFREELRKLGNREDAIREAASHSGVALLGSAASTMFGFAIIFFAPMPMFSSFGLLTALMILMAFVAALVVLPSLLMLVTPKEGKKGPRHDMQ